MNLKSALLLLFVCILSFISCGDDDDIWSDGSRDVKSIKINAVKANIGDIIAVDTYFQTKIEFGYPEDLELVIRISPELRYMNGSSKLYIEGDGHRRSPDYIMNCQDGTTYLWYSLDNDDDLKYYSGSKDFNMRFDIITDAYSRMAKIEASAGKHVNYSCDDEFMYQEEDGVIIE